MDEVGTHTACNMLAPPLPRKPSEIAAAGGWSLRPTWDPCGQTIIAAELRQGTPSPDPIYQSQGTYYGCQEDPLSSPLGSASMWQHSEGSVEGKKS